MNKELLQQALEMCYHSIPSYAYGDNEAACDMGSRLSAIGHLLAEALAQPVQPVHALPQGYEARPWDYSGQLYLESQMLAYAARSQA